MRYSNIVRGKFVDRPNRFIADVLIDGDPSDPAGEVSFIMEDALPYKLRYYLM